MNEFISYQNRLDSKVQVSYTGITPNHTKQIMVFDSIMQAKEYVFFWIRDEIADKLWSATKMYHDNLDRTLNLDPQRKATLLDVFTVIENLRKSSNYKDLTFYSSQAIAMLTSIAPNTNTRTGRYFKKHLNPIAKWTAWRKSQRSVIKHSNPSSII
jgi:hypothetical protein